MGAPGSIVDSIARAVCMALYSINAVSNVVCVVILGVIMAKGVGESAPPFNTALAIAMHGWCMVTNMTIQSAYWRRRLPPTHRSPCETFAVIVVGCIGLLVGAPCWDWFSQSRRFHSSELPSCRAVSNNVQSLLRKSRWRVERAYNAAELRRYVVLCQMSTLIHLLTEGLPLAIFQSMLLQTVLTAPVVNPNGFLLALKFALFTSIVSASLHLLFRFPHFCFSGDSPLNALRCCALIHDVLSAICMIRIFRSAEYAPWGNLLHQIWAVPPSGSDVLPWIWVASQMACYFVGCLVAIFWVVFHKGWSFRTKSLLCGLCVIALGPVVLLTWTLKFCLLIVVEAMYDEPMAGHCQSGKILMYEFLAEKDWEYRFQCLAKFVGDTIRVQLASPRSRDKFLQDIAYDWSTFMFQEGLIKEGPPTTRRKNPRLPLAWVYVIAIFQAFTFLFPYLVWMLVGQASSSSGSPVMGNAEKGLLLTSAVAVLPILALLPRQYRNLKFVVRCLPLYPIMLRLDQDAESLRRRGRQEIVRQSRRVGPSKSSEQIVHSPSVLIAALDSYYMWQPRADLAQTWLVDCLPNELLPFDVSQRITSFVAVHCIKFSRTDFEKVGELLPLDLPFHVEEDYRRVEEDEEESPVRVAFKQHRQLEEARRLLGDD